MNEPADIKSRDYWFKVVGMLQQNWAIIEQRDEGVRVFFLDDASGVFDEIDFDTEGAAKKALAINGFGPFAGDGNAIKFLHPPPPPFHLKCHTNGRIYSSGRFWKLA
jgi:hypothetical protein